MTAAGHPSLSSHSKGHGPDPARWTCCRELVDGPHADGCPNHHCDHESEAQRIHERYLRLQEAVVEETRCLPDVRRRILAVCE